MRTGLVTVASWFAVASVGCTIESNIHPHPVVVSGTAVVGGEVQAGVVPTAPQGSVVLQGGSGPQGAVVGVPGNGGPQGTVVGVPGGTGVPATGAVVVNPGGTAVPATGATVSGGGLMPTTAVVPVRPGPTAGVQVNTPVVSATTPTAPLGATVNPGMTVPAVTPTAPLGATVTPGMTVPAVTPTAPNGGAVVPGNLTVPSTTPPAGGLSPVAPNPQPIRRPIDPSQLRQPPPPVPVVAPVVVPTAPGAPR